MTPQPIIEEVSATKQQNLACHLYKLTALANRP